MLKQLVAAAQVLEYNMTREEYLATLTEDECQCDCHRPGVVMLHCVACCNTCIYCEKHIKRNVSQHFDRCKKD
jgi:hypothetical protein